MAKFQEKQLLIKLPAGIHKELKDIAKERHTSMKKLVLRAVVRLLREVIYK